MVLYSPPATESSRLSPYSHEEADTRMMVHVADEVEKGHKSVIIRTTDTDVICVSRCCGGISRLKRTVSVLPQYPYCASVCKNSWSF